MDLGIAPWLVALLGVIALVYAAQAYRRKSMPILDTSGRQRETVMWAGLIAGAFLLFWAGGWDYIAAQAGAMGVSGGGAPPAGGGTPTSPSECLSTTAPTVTLSGVVDGAPGTAVAAGTDFAYRIKGTTAWTNGNYGTGATMGAPGQTIQMMLGNNTAPAATSGNYYTISRELVMPCQQTVNINDANLPLKAVAANVATFYKNDQGTANTAITIANGQTKTGYITFTGEYQHSFGDKDCGANSNVLAVYYNRSEIQTIRIGNWAEVGCPGVVPNSAVANNVTKCFAMPVLTSDQTTGDVALTIQADATNNPAQDLVMIAFDSNRYQDTVSGEFACGASNNANADVGIASVVAPKLNVNIS